MQQESDAGTIVVPPSYDPAWAGSAGATAPSPPPGGLAPASPGSPDMSLASAASPSASAASEKASPDTSGVSSTGGVAQRLDEKARFVAALSAAEAGADTNDGKQTKDEKN